MDILIILLLLMNVIHWYHISIEKIPYGLQIVIILAYFACKIVCDYHRDSFGATTHQLISTNITIKAISRMHNLFIQQWYINTSASK
jgi:hypothetical protein